jgi:hypothetical protein
MAHVSGWTPLNAPTGPETSSNAGSSNNTVAKGTSSNEASTVSDRLKRYRETGHWRFTSEESKKIIVWMVENNAAGVIGHEIAFERLMTELRFNDESLDTNEKGSIRHKTCNKIKSVMATLIAKKALVCRKINARGELEVNFAPWTASFLRPSWNGDLTNEDWAHAGDMIEEDLGQEVPVVEALTKKDEAPACENEVYTPSYASNLNPKIAYRVFQLNASNYDAYIHQLQIICQLERIWDVFIGKTTYPSPPVEPLDDNSAEGQDGAQSYTTACRIYNEEKKEFVIKKGMCLGWLFSTMAEETRKALTGHPEPLEVLEILGKEFGNIHALAGKIG